MAKTKEWHMVSGIQCHASPHFGWASQRKRLNESNQALKELGIQNPQFVFNPKQAARVVAVTQKLKEAGFDLSDITISNSFYHGALLRKVAKGQGHGDITMDLSLFPKKIATLWAKAFDTTPDAIVIRFRPWRSLHAHVVKMLEYLPSSGRATEYHASKHPAQVIIHEYVHALHLKNLRKAGVTLKQASLPDELWKEIKTKVSYYAAAKKNFNEAIAEIGTAKLVGKQLDLSPELEKLWRNHWHGAELPFGLLKKVAR